MEAFRITTHNTEVVVKTKVAVKKITKNSKIYMKGEKDLAMRANQKNPKIYMKEEKDLAMRANQKQPELQENNIMKDYEHMNKHNELEQQKKQQETNRKMTGIKKPHN